MSQLPPRRVVIVGGVAGGASAAARLRRLDERAEIVMLERGPFVSFANCGLPYHVGGVIPAESSLLLMSPERFQERFRIDVRVQHEVVDVDAAERRLRVRHTGSGASFDLAYDTLVLATGAAPFRPPVPGLDLPGVFTLRTVPDTRALRDWIDTQGARRAVVVGAGFVGLEVAENLVHRGLEVTVVERLPQVLPPVDAEIAAHVADHLAKHGVKLVLGAGLAGITQGSGGLEVAVDGHEPLAADLVVLGLGVRPESGLAKAAGLRLGASGGVSVDEQMRTSDPHIYAVGDLVETRDLITGAHRLLPLAGPANRQGRVAADAIAGRESRFRGTQGTVICGLFGLAVAATGLTERAARAAGLPDVRTVTLHPNQHVGYYPGAASIHLKLVFDGEGRVLGAQAVGREGVDKRIDVIATAIQFGAKVTDLEHTELCYAPQFGAAKDPVNLAGMMASNHLRGDLPLADWDALPHSGATLVDVRERGEFARGHVPGAMNLPLSELRDRLDELPRHRELWLYCQSGKRSYDAARALLQHGFQVRDLPGGILSWAAMARARGEAGEPVVPLDLQRPSVDASA